VAEPQEFRIADEVGVADILDALARRAHAVLSENAALG